MIYDDNLHVRIWESAFSNPNTKWYLEHVAEEYGFKDDHQVYTTDFFCDKESGRAVIQIENKLKNLKLFVEECEFSAMGFVTKQIVFKNFTEPKESSTTWTESKKESNVIDITKYLK